MFVIMFIFPSLTYPIASNWLKDETLKDKEASLPKLSQDNYRIFPVLLEEYYNNRLPYRDFLIQFNSMISYFLFKESPTEKVIVGRDGWLFYSATIEDYKKNNLYSEEQLENIKNNMVKTNDYLENKGIKFILFIAPNKASIYGEYLPTNIVRQKGISRTEQLVKYLQDKTNVTVIFPKQELLAAKQSNPEYPLYFHLDTHWNYLGGYHGAKKLLESLGIEIASLDTLELEMINEPVFLWNGYDLSKMMGMTNILNKDVNFKIHGFSNCTVKKYQDTTKQEGAFVTFCRTISNTKDRRKVMLVRDSFASSMLPFLETSFHEIYSPHSSYFDKVSIDKEKPDIFILEIVERGDINRFILEED